MTRRLAWRLFLMIGSVGPLVGCSVYGLMGAWGGATTGLSSTVSAVANERIAYVSGKIDLPAGITAGKTLADLPALTNLSPMLGVAAMAGVYHYAVASLERTQATELAASTVTGAPIQFVDCLTGQVAATASTDAQGNYTAKLIFSGSQHAYIAQAILRNADQQVVGFLAAPLGIDLSTPSGKHSGIDLSPSSTMVAYSTALLSEIYPDVNLNQGFVGLPSQRLAAMTQQITPGALQSADTLMNQSSTFGTVDSFEELLSNVATASAVMTSEVKKVAAQALATDSLQVEAPGLNAAILGQLVTRIGAVSSVPAGTQGFLDAIASQVDLNQAKAVGDAIGSTLPSLPPLPAPTPAGGTSVTLN